MPVSSLEPFGRLRSSPSALFAGLLLALAGCGGSTNGGGQSGVPGQESLKPGGGLFFVDVNQSGKAANLHVAQVSWGRLVDIHEIDATGARVETPVFRDFLVEPDVPGFGSPYVLDRNPVTQRERLTIQARKTDADPNFDSSTFDTLLRNISDALPTVATKNDDGTSAPPFTAVPRNACMVVRFDDCLDDGSTATLNLATLVRVYTGYPPVTPFSARVVFDPNHGAIVSRDFHSTRVLIDMTTSEEEASALQVPQPVNAIGLPSRQLSSNGTNVSVRIPSRRDFGSGQFQILTNLSGVALDAGSNGPVDLESPTRDIVRAVKSGYSGATNPDGSNGFLADLERPRLIGGWGIDVTSAADDVAGELGLDFLLGFSFTTTCQIAPSAGDVIQVGGAFLQVSAAGTLNSGDVSGLEVRSVSPIVDADSLMGTGLYQAPFDPSFIPSGGSAAEIAAAKACWVSFLPEAATFPATGVSTTAQILLRFSEPMDPATLSPFGNFLVVKGASSASSTAIPSTIMLGDVLANADLTIFTFEPRSPLPHTQGVADPLHIEIAPPPGGPKDLAGNRLQNGLPFVDFTIAPAEATQRNAALVLRFDSSDEYGPSGGGPDGRADLRGQFFYDSSRGAIMPRPVTVTGWPVDRNNPVPQLMVPFPTGVFLPLTPLGCKQQLLWRYCDMGWVVQDETKYNLDVLGLSWSPIGGLVVADFYDQFEMRLGHSRLLPDEPRGNSGLPGSPNLFENNYLSGSNPKIVHNRALGYTINPANLFNSPGGTPMLPFPLNRGLSPDVTYTFRDTSILSVGGDGDTNQVGVPTSAEANAGVVTLQQAGKVAARGQVPSFGLPLLIEIKCHPSEQGLGLNRFDVSIAGIANFRAYSAGGINTLGNPVTVLPDSEAFPTGGFNPNSIPTPGAKTLFQADPVFYLGQLDTVVRVSRIHTAWLDAGSLVSPLWQNAVLEPSAAEQPSGTSVVLDYRSASSFGGTGTIELPFNAAAMDAYGNEAVAVGSSAVNPPNGLTDWSGDITLGNGKRYLQVRLTFLNNIATGLAPELTALGIPYGLQ